MLCKEIEICVRMDVFASEQVNIPLYSNRYGSESVTGKGGEFGVSFEDVGKWYMLTSVQYPRSSFYSGCKSVSV